MPIDDWGPVVKSNMETVHTAALAAEEIPTQGAVYGYNEWPADLLAFPATLIGTLGGSQDYSQSGPGLAFHNVKIWTLASAGLSLAETQKMVWPFVERVRNIFAQDMSLNATVASFLPPPTPAIFYEVGVINFAGTDYAGVIFNYILKDRENIAVQA